MAVVYYSNWNEAVWSYPKLNEDVPLGPKLNAVIVVCPELISLLEFTQIFPINENFFNFTQIWMKLSQFVELSWLLKLTQMILILFKFE